MKTYTEPSRSIPVYKEVDVLVAGIGPGGLGAALGAARAGARVLALDGAYAVGGMATVGMMSIWCGSTESPLLDEITARMLNDVTLPVDRNRVPASIITQESLRSVFLEMLEEAGVEVLLYTQVVAPIVENGRVVGVIVESKSGREAIMARVVIDGTGDGDLAARAGAEFTLGREEDHCCQPMTQMFRLGGVDYATAVFPGGFESYMELPKGEVQALGHRELPRPMGHVMLHLSRLPNEVCVNMTNVIEVDGTNARDLTKAELLCRKQIPLIIKFLREYVPGYSRCYLVAAGGIGVRETRHFKGVGIITEDDIVKGRIFEDWIATRNCFNFDIHSLKGPGLDEHGEQRKFRADGKYTIPYGACVPEKLDGLLLAGRSICGTHKAHSNFRVMAICLNMGQGVGAAAAQAVARGVEVRAVDVKQVQARLTEWGVRP